MQNMINKMGKTPLMHQLVIRAIKPRTPKVNSLRSMKIKTPKLKGIPNLNGSKEAI